MVLVFMVWIMKWIAFSFLCFSSITQATVIRFETVLGHFDVQLFDDVTPVTVANFLSYVNGQSFDESIIDTLEPGVFFQGGSFYYNPFTSSDTLAIIPRGQSIVNEAQLSNTRGTIGMVLDTENINSATNGWYINLRDNSVDLDGTYTVFGEVIGDGMQVLDAISALPTTNTTLLEFNLDRLPVINYNEGEIRRENLVVINQVRVIEEQQSISINAGLSGAWFNPESNSQGLFFEVLPNSNAVFLGWFTYDTELSPGSVTTTVGAAGQRWLSAQGPIKGNQVVMDVVLTSNGLFNSNQQTDRTEPGAYGTVTVVFEDCANGSVDYDLTAVGLSGTFNIVRIANDNVALCEQLNAETNN